MVRWFAKTHRAKIILSVVDVRGRLIGPVFFLPVMPRMRSVDRYAVSQIMVDPE